MDVPLNKGLFIAVSEHCMVGERFVLYVRRTYLQVLTSAYLFNIKFLYNTVYCIPQSRQQVAKIMVL